MADSMHFSLRFNYDKPEHRRIIDALEDIDRTKYTSKTHFIICALEHYIGWISNNSESLHREKTGDVVTRKELDRALDTVKAEIKSEVYAKILQCISGGGAQLKIAPSQGDSVSSGNLADDLSRYTGVMDSVMSWSEE